MGCSSSDLPSGTGRDDVVAWEESVAVVQMQVGCWEAAGIKCVKGGRGEGGVGLCLLCV